MAPRKKKEDDSKLLAALRFIEVAQSDAGAPYQMHCRIENNSIIAYDGILALGVVIGEETPNCLPHTKNLIHALEKAKGAIAVTVEDNKLTVKSNKFRAVVPTLSALDLPYVWPDNAAWPLTDDFRTAAAQSAVYTREGAQTVVGASVITRNGSLVGSNGFVAIEAWHGLSTPPGLKLPKTFIDALVKIKKQLTHFGFSETSFTVWFDDGSWLKTQLYMEAWPDIDRILHEAESSAPQDLPKDFWEGIKSVAPFSTDNRVYFSSKNMRSNAYEGVGADYSIKGLPETCLNYKHLLPLEGIADKWDFDSNERMVIFFGKNVRGAIAKSTP